MVSSELVMMVWCGPSTKSRIDRSSTSGMECFLTLAAAEVLQLKAVVPQLRSLPMGADG